MNDDIQPVDAENAPNSESGDSDAPIAVTMQRIEDLLDQGMIAEDHGRLRWSSNYTSLLTVQDEEIQALAVYKPQRGERPLWDFPDGTLCKREVAAYQVSKSLGWDLVAPTVLREASEGLGSVQLFIEHDPRITYFQLSDDFIPELQRMAAFDVIVNNTDRKGGHCLIDMQGKLWGIDHGICFHAHPKLRTVIWDFAGQPVPEALLQDIRQLCAVLEDTDSDLIRILRGLLSLTEVDALQSRVRRILASGCYPKPGPGPNYPWPAV